MTELNVGAGGHEKGKTKGSQRRGSNGELYDHSRSLGTFKIASNEAGIIEIPIYRANCQGRDPGRSAISGGDAIIGGILRNLIVQNRNQVARRQSDIKRIEDEIQELQQQGKEWEDLLGVIEETAEQNGEN